MKIMEIIIFAERDIGIFNKTSSMLEISMATCNPEIARRW
jgi:hypothetical protein